MKWNVFKALADRRRQKRERKELRQFSEVFALMEQMVKCGMMRWDEKLRRLYVMMPLALVQMRTPESWRGFMTNVYLWQQYKRQQEAWDNFILDEEMKAVRRARKKVAVLTKADTERIRRARREEIMMDDIKRPPKIEPYEIFIIRDTTEAETPSAEVVAVAAFDPDTEQIVIKEWEEVQELLAEQQEAAAQNKNSKKKNNN